MKKQDEIDVAIKSTLDEIKYFATIFNMKPEYVDYLKERFDYHYELYNQMIEQDGKNFYEFLLKQQLLEAEAYEQMQEHYKNQKTN